MHFDMDKLKILVSEFSGILIAAWASVLYYNNLHPFMNKDLIYAVGMFIAAMSGNVKPQDTPPEPGTKVTVEKVAPPA